MKIYILVLTAVFFNQITSAQLIIDKKFIDFGTLNSSNIYNTTVNLTIFNNSVSDTLVLLAIKTADSKSSFYLKSYEKSIQCFDDYINSYTSESDFKLLPKKSISLKVGIKKKVNSQQTVKDFIIIRYKFLNEFSLSYYSKVSEKTIPLVYSVKPLIKFVSTNLNLGVTNQGDNVLATYYFYNSTSKEINLEINNNLSYIDTIIFSPRIRPFSKDSITLRINTNNLSDIVEGVINIKLLNDIEFMYSLNFNFSVVNVKNYAFTEFESEIEYKNINYGSDGKIYFKFKNIGTIPLKITTCRTTGGNLIANLTNNQIFPGESGVIELVYNSKVIGSFAGTTCTVESNDRFNPIKVLRIFGKVLK